MFAYDIVGLHRSKIGAEQLYASTVLSVGHGSCRLYLQYGKRGQDHIVQFGSRPCKPAGNLTAMGGGPNCVPDTRLIAAYALTDTVAAARSDVARADPRQKKCRFGVRTSSGYTLRETLVTEAWLKSCCIRELSPAWCPNGAVVAAKPAQPSLRVVCLYVLIEYRWTCPPRFDSHRVT